MDFTKMHGLGNDYIYVNGLKEKTRDWSSLARYLSPAHTGIGADGLILILPSSKADFRMQMFNTDGSEGEMCGNGIRCVGKYVYDHRMTHKTKLTIETKAGVKTLFLTVCQGRVQEVKVDMGEPLIEKQELTVTLSNGRKFTGVNVSMGNPHFVTFVPKLTDKDVLSSGPLLEKASCFPNRTNVEFVEVVDKTHLKMRVWERGSGETMACGTGACATVCAAVFKKICQQEVQVDLLGGSLFIKWDTQNNHVFMTGPATTVYKGRINLRHLLQNMHQR